MAGDADRPATPAVSIVLPTYDRLPFLREAVDSVFAQSWIDWELLVVDDGSTDGTVEYVGALADHRVRLIRLPHRGIPAIVRNAGVTAACGRYVAFLDSDDWWLPNKLSCQLKALRGDRAARWSYTAFAVERARGDAIGGAARGHGRPMSGRIPREVLRRVTTVSTPTVLAETTLVREAGGFASRLRYGEDLHLWARLALRAPVCGVDEPLTTVREHGDRTIRAAANLERAIANVYDALRVDVADPEMRRICREEAARFHWAASATARRARRHGEAIIEAWESVRQRALATLGALAGVNAVGVHARSTSASRASTRASG